MVRFHQSLKLFSRSGRSPSWKTFRVLGVAKRASQKALTSSSVRARSLSLRFRGT